MLGTTSEHALRALTCLAALPEEKVMLGRDLAATADIPANYLSKILWALGNAGFIDATRGAGGGYRLSKPASQIRLYEIVELFDKQVAKDGCLMGGKPCSDDNTCTAHQSWKHVKRTYTDFLEKTTIADISKPAEKSTRKSSTQRRKAE